MDKPLGIREKDTVLSVCSLWHPGKLAHEQAILVECGSRLLAAHRWCKSSSAEASLEPGTT